jgi:hypothetical protein
MVAREKVKRTALKITIGNQNSRRQTIYAGYRIIEDRPNILAPSEYQKNRHHVDGRL